MKNTFYRQEYNSMEELNRLVSDMKANLEEFVGGMYNLGECEELIISHLENQDEKGFWGLIDPNGVPAEVRVDYFYMPTYYTTAFLMKFYLDFPERAKGIKGFETALANGLTASTGRNLKGAGYDGTAGQIMAMKIFCQAGVAGFIEQHGDICPVFKEVIENINNSYRESIVTSATRDGWKEDYLDGFTNILEYFETPEDDLLVFVYGTLLNGNSNYSSYLTEAEFCGEAVLHDYALYDLGSYPGIKPFTGDKVKGEVYKITPEILQRLNVLEGEGSLYLLESVTVSISGENTKDVLVYVYNNSISEADKIPFYNQPWGNSEKINPEEYVWYASYGSNMLLERFMSYIDGGICQFNGKMYYQCKDASGPKDVRTVMIPYKMYFGNKVSSWGEGGVSFLDLQSKGESYGRMYLITKEQFKHVHVQEGEGDNWYNEIKSIGECDGIPIQTITNKNLRAESLPGDKYLSVLHKGMKETYQGLCDETVWDYIKGAMNSNR